jgi:hypothetical protein
MKSPNTIPLILIGSVSFFSVSVDTNAASQ